MYYPKWFLFCILLLFQPYIQPLNPTTISNDDIHSLLSTAPCASGHPYDGRPGQKYIQQQCRGGVLGEILPWQGSPPPTAAGPPEALLPVARKRLGHPSGWASWGRHQGPAIWAYSPTPLKSQLIPPPSLGRALQPITATAK